MDESHPITIPLINPNEPSALVAALFVTTGQEIHPGEKICTLETTKSTQELYSDFNGYIAGLTVKEGEFVGAGDVLCYIAETPDWAPTAVNIEITKESTAIPTGLRISQPALKLAQQHNLDLSQLPGDKFVTEKMVQDLIDTSTQAQVALEKNDYKDNSIIIYGGGGHGKALIDLIRVLGTYTVAGIVDDGLQAGTNIMGVSVLGGSNLLEHLYKCGIHLAANAVGGIGNISNRIKVFERLAKAHFICPTLQHPSAFVETSASLAEGVQVFPHAYVGSEANVGFGAIINTGAIVSHDCSLDRYVNLSPGAILAGEVSIGEASLIGMSVTINLRVKVGKRARIGNGATVKQDVPEAGIVHAGTVWPE